MPELEINYLFTIYMTYGRHLVMPDIQVKGHDNEKIVSIFDNKTAH
jgi:hypothetical protein